MMKKTKMEMRLFNPDDASWLSEWMDYKPIKNLQFIRGHSEDTYSDTHKGMWSFIHKPSRTGVCFAIRIVRH